LTDAQDIRIWIDPYDVHLDPELALDAAEVEAFLREYTAKRPAVDPGELQDALMERFDRTLMVTQAIVSTRAVHLSIWKPGISHSIGTGPNPNFG
jgi:hypothetical protein